MQYSFYQLPTRGKGGRTVSRLIVETIKSNCQHSKNTHFFHNHFLLCNYSNLLIFIYKYYCRSENIGSIKVIVGGYGIIFSKIRLTVIMKWLKNDVY